MPSASQISKGVAFHLFVLGLSTFVQCHTWLRSSVSSETIPYSESLPLAKSLLSGEQNVLLYTKFIQPNLWEFICGIILFVVYLSMAGNSPYGFLYVSLMFSVTNADWKWFCNTFENQVLPKLTFTISNTVNNLNITQHQFSHVSPAVDSLKLLNLDLVKPEKHSPELIFWLIMLVWVFLFGMYYLHGFLLFPFDVMHALTGDDGAVSRKSKKNPNLGLGLHKIQWKKKLQFYKLPQVFYNTFSNMIFVALPTILSFAILAVVSGGKQGPFVDTDGIPSKKTQLYHWVILLLVDEVLFFYGHWFLHLKSGISIFFIELLTFNLLTH